jgi:hypothetical protein
MKTWELKFEVFWDANHIHTVTVKANTERKAVILGTEKTKKETGWDMPKLLSCKEVAYA